MLIKALCDYYDCMQANMSESDKISDCFQKQDVDFMIFLTPDGKISDITDIRGIKEEQDKKGKIKKIYTSKKIILPKRSQKPGIDLNIIEHRPLYIFGLNYDKDTGLLSPKDETNKAKKSHECFVNGNLNFCENINSPLVQAYRNFLNTWDPNAEIENKALKNLGKEYGKSHYYCFALDGHPEIQLQEDKEILSKYEKLFRENISSSTEEHIAVCPIEGKKLKISRIHEKIKGIAGGMSTGLILVGINDTAFESYGKEQSYNSNISEIAMKKYTGALNDLLANKAHKILIGDITVIFFAISGKNNNEKECDLFQFMINGDSNDNIEPELKSILNEWKNGRSTDLKNINKDTDFYIAGLAPNSSRISQKFIMHNKFGVIMDNILQHQKDIALKDDINQIPLWKISKQLVSPKSDNEKASPPLIASIFYSIIKGIKYPESLLATMVRRLKTDNDIKNISEQMKIRIGIIKGCLNRKNRIQKKKEEITMSLNRENKNPAYLCGRLFAALEYIQQKSANSNLNKTIKDSFFSSACSKPSTVFPRLVVLAQNHIGKLTENNKIFFNKIISEIINQLSNKFPQTLSLDEQGNFIIGYYQQNADFYLSKNEKNTNEEE